VVSRRAGVPEKGHTSLLGVRLFEKPQVSCLGKWGRLASLSFPAQSFCQRLCVLPFFTDARACDCKTITGQSGAVPSGKDPPLLTVNLLEASVPHDHRATLAQRSTHDFIAMFLCASHPGQYQ